MTEKDKNSIGRKSVTIDQDNEKDVMNNRKSKKFNRTYVPGATKFREWFTG
jgi:hypothetical protein